MKFISILWAGIEVFLYISPLIITEFVSKFARNEKNSNDIILNIIIE